MSENKKKGFKTWRDPRKTWEMSTLSKRFKPQNMSKESVRPENSEASGGSFKKLDDF